MNLETDKLRALLEGLETQNIDKLMSEGKVGDFRNYGTAYLNAVKDKVDSSFKKGAHQALDEAEKEIDKDDGATHHSEIFLSLKEKY